MEGEIIIDKVQVRMARAALGWTRDELAARSDVSLNTIVRIEAGGVPPRKLTQKAIRSAFEQRGVRFPAPGIADASKIEVPQSQQAA